jgi:hypothetical protein
MFRTQAFLSLITAWHVVSSDREEQIRLDPHCFFLAKAVHSAVIPLADKVDVCKIIWGATVFLKKRGFFVLSFSCPPFPVHKMLRPYGTPTGPHFVIFFRNGRYRYHNCCFL